MPIDDELSSIADAMEALQPKFVRGNSELFLRGADESEFTRLAVEAKSMLDEALGRGNDFSSNLTKTIALGQVGFMGGPSHNCVGSSAAIIRGAVNQIRRRRTAPAAVAPTLQPSTTPYVDLGRLEALRGISAKGHDPSRLMQLCQELNVAHEHNCFMSIAMLVRAIVDHVPPIFGFGSFAEVSNNYSGSKSFKASMTHLDRSLRNIADSHLHQQIRQNESVPTAAQVNFGADLDVLLAEVVRITK